MKRDLTTTLIAAVIGVVAAYFMTNMFLPEIANVPVKTLSGNTNYTLAEPSDDIFNYRAVNPTVEVYVGQCAEYNEEGVCIDDGISGGQDDEQNEENEENGEVENGITD